MALLNPMTTSSGTKIINWRHPFYDIRSLDWYLWRRTYMGGTRYIQMYLKTFSLREDPAEFELRKQVTYCPAFVKSAINEVKDAIFQRMVDITRENGPQSYMDAIKGLNNGVDLLGSTMNYFMGQRVLPELLVMGRVGVYVDMPRLAEAVTILDQQTSGMHPYLYVYTTEDILNWSIDTKRGTDEFTSLMLREEIDEVDPGSGLPTGKSKTRFRHMHRDPDSGQLAVAFYDMEGSMVDINGDVTDVPLLLSISKIPFVLVELSDSLMNDISRYQIALLNLASSDIYYALKSNFPFYTEQHDFAFSNAYSRGPSPDGGGAADAGYSQANEIQVGTGSGRKYPKGTERPGFIAPPTDPMRASMEKQEQLKLEIRQLIKLAVQNLVPAKGATPPTDNQTLEAGLNCIGMEMNRAESKIADFWGSYENSKAKTSVIYPETYDLKSDEDRREEQDQLTELLPMVPSQTYRKEIAKQLAKSILGHKISAGLVKKIMDEIDKAEIVSIDPALINQDVVAGILDKQSAADARGYPKDTVDKANAEHAERLSIIQKSQTSSQTNGDGTPVPGARGVPDLSGDPKKDASDEKLLSQKNREFDPIPADRTRGKGK